MSTLTAPTHPPRAVTHPTAQHLGFSSSRGLGDPAALRASPPAIQDLRTPLTSHALTQTPHMRLEYSPQTAVGSVLPGSGFDCR